YPPTAPAIEPTQAPLKTLENMTAEECGVPAQAELEVVAWSYEYHDFGEIWPQGVILNRPDGGATPPTAHHGSPVRNVQALVRLTDARAALAAKGGEFQGLKRRADAAEARNAELVKALEPF